MSRSWLWSVKAHGYEAESEAGLALEEMGLLEVDELEMAGYASTESEDLWDAYADDHTEALAGYPGDRTSPAFSDARSAHGRGSGSGRGGMGMHGCQGKTSQGCQGRTSQGQELKGQRRQRQRQVNQQGWQTGTSSWAYYQAGQWQIQA